MEIIDAQLHEPAIRLDWADTDTATRYRALSEVQLATVDAAGVDRAIVYPADPRWADELATRFPDRFAVVPALAPGGQLTGFTPAGVVNRLDPLRPDIADLLRAEAAKPYCVGFRMMDRRSLPAGMTDAQLIAAYTPVLETCAELGQVVFMSTARDTSTPRLLARRFPDVTVVIDHLGLPQPPTHTPDNPPLRGLPGLLALADVPNIAVKVTGAPTLSREGFPFRDVSAALRQLIETFGAGRLMWGSDIARVHGKIGFNPELTPYRKPYAGWHTYAEAVHWIRDAPDLDAAEKQLLLGGTVRRLVAWPAGTSALLR